MITKNNTAVFYLLVCCLAFSYLNNLTGANSIQPGEPELVDIGALDLIERTISAKLAQFNREQLSSTAPVVVVQFVHQALDRLIQRHPEQVDADDDDLIYNPIKTQELSLWQALFDYPDQRALVDLFALLDRLVEVQVLQERTHCSSWQTKELKRLRSKLRDQQG